MGLVELLMVPTITWWAIRGPATNWRTNPAIPLEKATEMLRPIIECSYGGKD
jgi:hypothetical protein